ncbi:MAG: hypothetical protein U0M06_09495 [Clostridia bacterium]|nr:hypothetical protein [Clostridia bacterium]
MNAIVPKKLSNAQMKALDGSIREQIGQNIVKLKGNIEAIVLWQLHEQYGSGAKKLEAFLEGFQPALQELMNFYGVESTEDIELACIYNLKSIGFDTEKLGKAFPVEWTINGRK